MSSMRVRPARDGELRNGRWDGDSRRRARVLPVQHCVSPCAVWRRGRDDDVRQMAVVVGWRVRSGQRQLVKKDGRSHSGDGEEGRWFGLTR